MTRRFSSMRRNLRVALPLAALVLLWELVARSGWVSAYLLPGPLAVLATGARLFQSGVLAAHAAASLARIGVGFLISCTAGIALAGAVAQFRLVEDLTAAPLALALALLRMIPPLALTPLLVLWLGIGNATQISIIVLASFFSGVSECAGRLSLRDGARRRAGAQPGFAALGVCGLHCGAGGRAFAGDGSAPGFWLQLAGADCGGADCGGQRAGLSDS